jgi:hypothetical protein
MKKMSLILIVAVFFAASLFALEKMGDEKEKTAIKQTALDYIEGWYSGNPERMERALYTDLSKRGVFVNPETGKTLVRPVTAEALVGYAKKGAGKKPEDEWAIELTIQDIYRNTASVKIVSVDFIDYAHIGKVDGEWKIINVLWEPIRKKK